MTQLLMRLGVILLIVAGSLSLFTIWVGKVLPSRGFLAFVALVDQVPYLWEIDPTYGISMPIVEDVSTNFPLLPSPDGQQIAFYNNVVEGTQLGIVNADGSKLRLLDNEDYNLRSYNIFSTAWLPNNTEIVMMPPGDAPRIINVFTLDSTVTLQISLPMCGFTALSPDGQLIAGLASSENVNGSFSCGSDGIVIVDLASGENIHGFPDERGLTPLWSPDSHRLAFFGLSGLFIATTDSTTPMYQLLPSVFSAATSSPVWSPDGTRLAMAMGSNPDIYVVDAEEGAVSHDLTPLPSVEYFPAWSPDSTEIAFVATSRLISEIYIVNVETGAIRRVTHNNLNELNLMWLP
jgi:Tol biopolymer transport system component